MGEIADGMIAGESCESCGVYFVKAHGYPVLCESCWDDFSTTKEREGHQRAIYEEIELEEEDD